MMMKMIMIMIKMMRTIAMMMLILLTMMTMLIENFNFAWIILEANSDFVVRVIQSLVAQPSPGDEKYFKGGEITRMYGSRDSGQVEKI